MTIDVERARAVTPGAEKVCHLNNAGAALAPTPVLDAVIRHLRLEADIGGYEAADRAAGAMAAVYEGVATLIGAQADEIALVESATTAWNAAFCSIQFRPGDCILTGRAEYGSNAINLLLARERFGVEVVVIDDDEFGQISLEALSEAIDERTKLIALTHVPTGGALVNPAAAVGAIARDAGVLYLLDACQATGQMPLDVSELGCDFFSATGRKFLRGPRGTGFLYVRSEVVEDLHPFQLDIRSAAWTSATTYEVEAKATRFESWENSVANRLGLGAAIDHALSWGLDDIRDRIGHLAGRLRIELGAMDRVTVHDKGRQKCGIVTFAVEGMTAGTVRAALGSAGVNTSVTSVASARFDFPDRGLDELVRASPHYYNTDSELDRLIEVVAALA